MRTRFLRFFFALLILVGVEKARSLSPLPWTSGVAQVRAEESAGRFDQVPGELIVLLSPQVTKSQVQWQHAFQQGGFKGQVVQTPALKVLNAAIVRVPAGTERAAKKALENLPGVRWVEPNYVVRPAFIPNDPYWPDQYGFTRIQAPEAWDITTGDSSIVVAVVDSGVDGSHPDLQGRLAGGYDFVNNDSVPEDRCGHGTHVAGIIAANTNNAVGVAGMASGVQILPVKVLGGYCSGSVADVAEGIVWATEHGAKIINLSLGAYTNSSLLENATFYAYQHGVAIFAASGNYGDSQVLYPAAYPWVLAVGATDQNDDKASFSNTGPELDVMAPGVDILSTTPQGSFYYQTVVGTSSVYGKLSGTSMATAFVSGAAALLASEPQFDSPDAIYQALTETAKDLDVPGRDDNTGWGLIQVKDALLFTPHLSPTPTPVPPDFAYDMLDSRQCANLVQYHWVEVASDDPTQALPIFGNDGHVTLNLPFPFSFGGSTYDSATISADGYVTFTGYGGEPENFFIPGIAEPNNFVAPFWDDLSPSVKGLIFADTVGTAPDRQWVVEWQNIALGGQLDSGLTFEVILSEADNSITFQYKRLQGNGSRGAGATVGIEYLDGTAGVQYSYNQPALSEGLAIRFVPRPVNAPTLTTECVPAAAEPTAEPENSGILMTSDGGMANFAPFCVDVPQGTLRLSSYLNADVLTSAPPSPAAWVDLGKYLRITLSPPQEHFSPPIYLCYAYTARDLELAGGNPSNLHFAFYDPVQYQWVLLPTVAAPERGVIWAPTTHFSTFGVFVVTPQDLPVTGAFFSPKEAWWLFVGLAILVLGGWLIFRKPSEHRV